MADKTPVGLDLVNVEPRYGQETKAEYWERYRNEYKKVYGEFPETPVDSKDLKTV